MEIHGTGTSAISSFISNVGSAISSASSKVYNACKSSVGTVSDGFQKIAQGAYNRLSGEHKASRESAKNTAIYNSIVPSEKQMKDFLSSLPHDLQPKDINSYVESKTTISESKLAEGKEKVEIAKAEAREAEANAEAADAAARQIKADNMRETFDKLGF